MGTGSIPGGKAAGSWCWPTTPPPQFSAKVKERVELCLYFPLWAFVACSRVKFIFTLHKDEWFGFFSRTTFWHVGLEIISNLVSEQQTTYEVFMLLMNVTTICAPSARYCWLIIYKTFAFCDTLCLLCVCVGVGGGECTDIILTFRGLCVVLYSYNKTNEMH